MFCSASTYATDKRVGNRRIHRIPLFVDNVFYVLSKLNRSGVSMLLVEENLKKLFVQGSFCTAMHCLRRLR